MHMAKKSELNLLGHHTHLNILVGKAVGKKVIKILWNLQKLILKS